MTGKERNVLPTERIGRSSRRGIAATVAVVLASGVLLNLGLGILLRSRPGLDNPTYAAFHEQWQRLVTLEEPVETLVLGDSSGRHGVDPEILDEALGTVSLNLCTMGNAAITNPAWQLEVYLRRFGAPRRVILVAVHDAWKRDMKLPLIMRVPLGWGFWRSMRAPLALDRRELRDVFLSRYVPAYSQDKTVQELLMYPWRAGRKRLWFSERGFAPIWRPDPQRAIDDGAGHGKWTAPHGWKISASSREALAAMMAMADEAGFEFYVANSPQLEGMVEDEVFGPYYAEGQRRLAEILAASPRAHLILSPPAEYPPEKMQNSDHIAADSVDDFTRRLAAAVAACEHDPTVAPPGTQPAGR